jgi:hypothetical protein
VLKRDVVTGGVRELHNEEFHTLYFSSNVNRMINSSKMKWVGHVVRLGKIRNAYNILLENVTRKRSLGRPKHKWEDNIKINL